MAYVVAFPVGQLRHASRLKWFSIPRAGGTVSSHLFGTNRSFSNSERKARDPNQIKLDHAHCVELVQQRDREGYLCGLLMPSHARKSYFAIRAFNVELASVKDGSDRRRAGGGQSTTDGSSLAFRMRMQWWRDALAELYPENGESSPAQEGPRSAASFAGASGSCWHNPVVRALNHAVEESNLTRRFLERLLDAREADLEIQQMATIDDALLYAEDTISSLLYLSLECVGIREDAADVVASHAGMGIGLINGLRSATHRVSLGELSIPADAFSRRIPPPQYLMARHDPEFENNAEYDESLREAVQQVAHVASSHLTRARELQRDVPKAGRPCLLPAVPAMRYLERLQEVNFDLYDESIVSKRSRLELLSLLGRTWLIGVF